MKEKIFLSDKLNLTNNAVEGMNSLIGQFIKQGRITAEDFGDMIKDVNSCFRAKIISKERKILPTDQKKTFISNIMLYLARCSTNTNLLKGN